MSEYVDCSFDRSRIRAHAPGRVRFVRCSFRDVRLKEWFCWDAEFVDCVFTGKAQKLIFNGDVPEDAREELGRATNEYRGNDFSGMELHEVDFRGGIDLTEQIVPSGDEYVLLLDAREAIVRARAQVSLWDDDARREEALGLLRLFMEDVERGQEQLFLCPADFARYDDAATLRDLFALLTDA